ncbi:MAG: DNA cytosine methyltransferase [Melioribacteraceae bacterium]|nr:DNA cytosine methyltransferase [Melioribacteraceae bacterium]
MGRKPDHNSISRNAKRQTYHIQNDLIEKINSFCDSKSLNKSSFVNELFYSYFAKKSDSDNSKYKVVSLFSGCGGMDLGFQGDFTYLGKNYPARNFEIVFANDIMGAACKTYKENFKHTPHIGDIKEYLDFNGIIPDCDVVIGGFPCQDFSLAGKRNGLNSERGRLYEQMKRVIALKRPKIFIAENVKGLSIGDALETIKRDFSNIEPKYEITHFLKMAADFGVPQTRERIFIVGTRKEYDISFVPPTETHSADGNEDRELWISSKQAIGDLESLENDVPNHSQYSKARNYGSHLQGNKPIKADYPSPTIRAEHHGNIEFHYCLDRRLTVRECARIQSFPDNFVFHSSASKNYVVIGNAVPPVLGWNIAKSVEDYLDKLK